MVVRADGQGVLGFQPLVKDGEAVGGATEGVQAKLEFLSRDTIGYPEG